MVAHVLTERLAVKPVNISAHILGRWNGPRLVQHPGTATALRFDGHFFASLPVARNELGVLYREVTDPLDSKPHFTKAAAIAISYRAP